MSPVGVPGRLRGSDPRPVSIVGAPCDLGGNRRGAAGGPAALRAAGLLERLAAAGLVVSDCGDAPVPCAQPGAAIDPTKRHIDQIAAVAAALYDLTYRALCNGHTPVILGGDHSISAGSAAASATYLRERTGGPLGVIWIDAHGDMNTPATTLTGNVHGMPLAALVGEEPAELAGIGGWSRKVSPELVVLLGIRDLDDAEREAIDAAGMHVFTAEDVLRRGVRAVMRDVLSVLAETDAVHVSLDLDACDPDEAPGVSTPVAGGLPCDVLHEVLTTLAAAAPVMALDLVEVNPECDVRNATAALGVELALSALADRVVVA